MKSGFHVRPLLILVSLATAGAPPGRVTVQGARTIWADAEDGATISPDGRLVAFVDWNSGDLAARELSTGNNRHLTNKGGWEEDRSWAEPPLVFSPKGDRIVYPYANARAADPYRYELRLLELDDTVQQVLAVLPADAAFIAPLDWHPVAGILFTTIAADESSELRIVRPDDRSVRVLERRKPGSGAAHHGRFLPDGSAVVYLANGKLERISLHGGGARDVGLRAEALLGWSREGGTLLFHATRGRVTGNWAVSMREGHPVGQPTLVQPTAAGVLAGGWTAEGVHYVEPAETPRLFLASVDLATGGVLAAPAPITPGAGSAAGSPRWSRDGSRLAYTLKVPNRTVYRVMVADGPRAAAREIARVSLRVMGLDWSADGRFLVIAGRGEARGSSWVGRITVATGAVERLVQQPTSAVAAGRDEQVAYVRAALAGESTVQVVVLPQPGASPRVLATYPVEELPRSVSVSPDGEWVAIVKPVEGRTASVLQLLPLAGGDPRTVLRLERPDFLEWNLGSIPWTPDGKQLLVMMRRQGKSQLAAVGVSSGQVTPLSLILEQSGRKQPALHPDGRQVIYVDGVSRADLRLMPRRAP